MSEGIYMYIILMYVSYTGYVGWLDFRDVCSFVLARNFLSNGCRERMIFGIRVHGLYI